MSKNVHRSFLYSSPKLETTQTSINRRVNKLNIMYAQNEATDTHRWISQTYRLKEARQKGVHCLISFIWSSRIGKLHLWRDESEQLCLGRGFTQERHEDAGNALYPNVGGGDIGVVYVCTHICKSSLIYVHLRLVHILYVTEYILYLNKKVKKKLSMKVWSDVGFLLINFLSQRILQGILLYGRRKRCCFASGSHYLAVWFWTNGI